MYHVIYSSIIRSMFVAIFYTDLSKLTTRFVESLFDIIMIKIDLFHAIQYQMVPFLIAGHIIMFSLGQATNILNDLPYPHPRIHTSIVLLAAIGAML